MRIFLCLVALLFVSQDSLAQDNTYWVPAEGMPGNSQGYEGDAMPPDISELIIEPDYATPIQTCEFDEYVGQNVDDIMSALESLGRPLRIVHPMSQMTMDYNPDRINVNIDEDTRLIETISCG